MTGDFEPISKSEAEKRIERMRNIDTVSKNVDVIKKDIDTTGMRSEMIRLDEGTDIYRARILEEKPTTVSELSYPPKQVAKLNRANRDHNPIFYGCSGGGASVFELNPAPGEKVAVLKWQNTKPIDLHIIGYSTKVLDRFDSSRDPNDLPEGSIADDESEGNALLREYFADVFTREVPDDEKHHHKLTTAIAEMWMSGEPDGILYPSVKMWANEDNFAIDRDVVDEALAPLSAEFIEIQSREGKEIGKETLDTCTTIRNGELEWNGHAQQWVLEEDNAVGTFVYEDGRWQAKNAGIGEVRVLHDQDFQY